MTRPPGRPAIGRPGDGQLGLDGMPAPAGVVAAAVEHAIAAADESDQLLAGDVVLIALALKLAAAVDTCDARGDTRGVVTASRELQLLLAQLGVYSTRPPPRKEGSEDEVDSWLARLGTPAVGDASLA